MLKLLAAKNERPWMKDFMSTCPLDVSLGHTFNL